jgi:CubicO group peptidase (beta-lactamase class C family)
MLRIILCLFLLATTCFAQDVARMDEAVQSYVANEQFMGSALVARGDQVLFSKSYGSANLEWDIPNTTDTKYRIGSVTKQFTAACILLLEERGLLKIDDPVGMYLPDAPAAWEKVTVYHVMTHTAGIPSFTNSPKFMDIRPFEHTPEELVALFRDEPLEFEPGEKMAYSNSGYVLLGYLLEKVTGESYQDFIQKNIFDPLGMKDSGYDSNFDIIPRRAAGYTPSPDGPQNAEFEHMSIPFSAGALYSTTGDLWRWQQCLYGGKLLSENSLKKMTEPFKDGYALGIGVNEKGRKAFSHGGGISGFNSYLAYYPKDKVTVVVLGNLNGIGPQQIAGSLASLAHGEEVILASELKEITLPREILEQYVGTYRLMPNFNLMITVEDDQLMSQASGQGKLPLFASSETEFFNKMVNARIDFIKDNKGKVNSLTLHQHGNDINGPRISDTVEVRKEIQLSPEDLQQYVGIYELQPGVDVMITLEGEQLFTQIEDQPKFPLFAESENEFFLKVVDSQHEYIKDDKGVVTHVIIRQGPMEIEAPRRP